MWAQLRATPRRLAAGPALPLINFKPSPTRAPVAPGRTRVDLQWMEVTDPGRDLVSDSTADLNTGYVPGDGSMLKGQSYKFARPPYSDKDLETLKAEREEGVERRADGSIPCYWAPEYSANVVRGLKFRIKFPERPEWDGRAADVLPGDLGLRHWERQIKYGQRAAHHTHPWHDNRGVRQYKVHKFPAGEFLEICGHLVRINYRAPYWMPNERALRNFNKRGVWRPPKPDASGHGQRTHGFSPYITEMWPAQSMFARYREGSLGTVKEWFADLKALGPVAMFMKIYRLRYFWWGSNGKILVGIDSNGFKYFETPYGAGLSHRARMVEHPWGPTWRIPDDIHPAWRTWLTYACLAPPNEPEAWPTFATEYHHMEGRWLHNFGVQIHHTSLLNSRAGSIRAGHGRSVVVSFLTPLVSYHAAGLIERVVVVGFLPCNVCLAVACPSAHTWFVCRMWLSLMILTCTLHLEAVSSSLVTSFFPPRQSRCGRRRRLQPERSRHSHPRVERSSAQHWIPMGELGVWSGLLLWV